MREMVDDILHQKENKKKEKNRTNSSKAIQTYITGFVVRDLGRSKLLTLEEHSKLSVCI